MHIALAVPPYVAVPPVRYGGTERVVYYLIQGLLEEGHQVTLLASGDSQVDCNLIPICDTAIPVAQDILEEAKRRSLRAQAREKLEAKLRSLLPEIDLIHFHGGLEMAEIANKFKDFPHILTTHNTINLQELSDYAKFKDVNFVSISKNQQQAALNLNWVGTVYNGIDFNDFYFDPQPEDYMCFLGRFDRDKNPHLAMQLAIALGVKLKIAGKLDLAGLDYFKQECQPYIEHPLIEYLGEVGGQERAHLLAKAKVNLHPAGYREGFGLTVIEAAFCGVPTLAIRKGSMPELIEEGRTGVLVEDFAEAYHKIGQCYSMDREYISIRARHLFNYRVMTNKYIKIYHQILAGVGQD
jgi:glycosyltransferase involved in cell wall biosynthesis